MWCLFFFLVRHRVFNVDAKSLASCQMLPAQHVFGGALLHVVLRHTTLLCGVFNSMLS